MRKFVHPPDEINTPERSLDSFFEQDKLRYELAEVYCKNQVILDLGCGLGYGSNLLSQNAAQVFGVDYSKATIEFDSKAYSNPKLSFFATDARVLGLKSKIFDAVVSIEVFSFIRESDLFLKEVRRVLKEKGTFIMSTPNKIFHQRDEIGLKFHYPYHVNLLNFRSLKIILSRYFPSIKILGIRKKRNTIYNFLRWLDFLNFRLLLSQRQRNLIERDIVSLRESEIEKFEEKLELREVNFLNAHTFQVFFVVCKV